MGTRSMSGLRMNGIDKCMYNGHDGYPDGLGADIWDYISNHTDEELISLFNRIKLVSESKKYNSLSNKQKKKSEKYIKNNFEISYEDLVKVNANFILSNIKGDFTTYDEYPELELMLDGKWFIKDSLFCEWAYIINLDTSKLEIWEGFQKKPQEGNRYGTRKNKDGFYPCALVKEVKFKHIRAFQHLNIVDLLKVS